MSGVAASAGALNSFLRSLATTPEVQRVLAEMHQALDTGDVRAILAAHARMEPHNGNWDRAGVRQELAYRGRADALIELLQQQWLCPYDALDVAMCTATAEQARAVAPYLCYYDRYVAVLLMSNAGRAAQAENVARAPPPMDVAALHALDVARMATCMKCDNPSDIRVGDQERRCKGLVDDWLREREQQTRAAQG